MPLITLIKPEDLLTLLEIKSKLKRMHDETEERRLLAIERGDRAIARLLGDVIIKTETVINELYQLQLSAKGNTNEA
jgi:hypothetical protein